MFLIYQGIAAEKNVISLEAESVKKGTKQSPEKPVPDSADSPDLVGSCPPTDNNMKDDDIKKRVRINKDGSLSMEMKVRFRLQNDETLHWSTKVKKTSGGTCEFKQGHSNAYFAQVSDRSFSESETISAEEAWVSRSYQRHAEEPHCPQCFSHFRDYDIWENVPDTHGANRCVHSSSSSASSYAVVSRKTIVEMQSMSRSSEELTEQVIEKETCIKSITQAAETVEYCTVSDEGEGASQRTSRASQKSNSEVNFKKQASRSSGGSITSNNPDLYQICQCEVPAGHPNERNEQNINQAEEERGILTSAMSVKSPASNTSENTENAACRENQGRRSKSAMLCYSDASTNSTCGVLDVATKGQRTADVKASQERSPSTQSVKSVKGERSVKLEQSQEYLKPEENGKERRPLSSVSSKVSTKSKGSRISSVPSERPADEDLEQRTPSTMSAISSVSAELKHIAYETSEEESSQSSAEEKESDPNVQSRISEEGYFSPKLENKRTQGAQSVGSNSSAPLQKSTDFEATTVRTTSVMSVKSNASAKSADAESHDANSENTNQERPQSTHSTQSVKSIVSNKSTKSERPQTAEILEHKDDDSVENGDVEEPREVTKMSNNSEERTAGSLFQSKVTPVQKSDTHGDNSHETLFDGEIQRSLSSLSATSKRSNCSGCPPNENTEISLDENRVHTEDSSSSSISVNSVQSHTQRASSALSSKSAKSCTSMKSNKSNTENFGDKTSKEEAPERPQSGVSVISTESREGDLVAEKHMSECKKHVERIPSNLSVRSEKSHTSLTSQKTNVSDICLGNEDSIVDGEDEQRPLSSHSVVSDVSVRSNKSKCQNDDSRETPDVKNTRESNEVRPSSSKSSRSKQSSASKKSEKRPQSALSAKSAKSVKSEVLSVENGIKAGTQEDPDESQERAKSVLSAKSGKSVKSAKSHKLEESDVKENVSDSDHENRPPSILSVRSAKSTMSKVSTTSKKSNISETCLEGGVDNLDERNIKGGSGSEHVRSASVQSVKSSVSKKSKTPESRVGVPPDEESVTSKQSSKEDVNERPPSDMSAKSEESSFSEMSINSAETANSARSSKSARSRGSTKSVKSKASENCSGKIPDEKRGENLEGTNGQDCPTEKEASDDDLPVERALSELSGKSATLNAATDVYEVCSEDGVDHPDKRIVRGGSEGRLPSAQSFDSNISANESNCTTDVPVGSDIVSSEETFKELEVERAGSAVSTKSVHSNISEMSGSHGKKTSSALSAKSTKSSTSEKSVRSKDSEPQSARASTVDSKDQERTGSAISVQSNNSENSVQSNRPQCSDVESPTDCEEQADRAQTNLSIKSGKSAKSKISTASKRSNVSEEVNTDGDNIVSEERASSCTSNKSVQSHVTERSRKSCAAGTHEDSAERTQSALSVKSTRSTKSNESKGMDDSAKRHTPDEKEKASRTLSNMSERSKSIESNVSAVSKNSEVSVSCELNTEDATEKQHEEEDLGNRSVKSNTSARSSRSKCESDFPNKENSRPRSQGSAISVKSNMSGSSVHNTPDERYEEESQDRAKSTSSKKSRTSKKSKKSKVSASPAEGSASDSDDMTRSASSLSASSAKSNFSEAKKSKASNQQSGHETEATDADNEDRMSSLSTLTNRSNISARSKLSKCSDTVASQNLESESNDCDEEKSCTSVKSDQSRLSKKSKKHKELATDDLAVDKKEKTMARTPSTLSARSTKTLSSKSTQSEKSIKSKGLKESDAPANDCASEKSNTSVQSQRSMEAGLLEESAIGEKTKGAPSDALTGSEDSVERGQSVMSVTSSGSRKSSKYRKLQAVSNEEQTTEEVERSPSNMSGTTNKTSIYASSRNVTPHGELSEDFTNEEERSTSIVSAKSSTSTKSTQKSFSTKSSKSKISDAQRQEKPDEQMNRALSKASMNSAKSSHSDECNKLQGSNVSPEQVVHAVDENKGEDACKRALSPISVKSNATSTTTKSNLSYDAKRSRNVEGLETKNKEDDDVKKTPSVLSVESNTSSKTMQSNRSGTSNKKTIRDKEDTDNIKDGVQSTESAKSHKSEVPAVTIEESEDRSPTTMSLKSKSSGRSKKSKSSEGQKSERKSKGSLSVHSHLSAKSKRSTVTNVSAATVTSTNPAEVVKVRGISGSHLSDKKQANAMSDYAKQPLEGKNQLIRQAESKESDMSQTLSSLEVVKETDGAAEPPESKSVSEIDTNYRPKSKEADEYELVPSILPNASPTEVVNEWLKTIPPESDIYEMEDLSENSEKISQAAEGGNEVEDSKKTDNSSAETSKDIDTGGAIHPDLDDECKTGTETSNDNNGSPQTADASKILNSSVQVMRVLLNPKSDRCNSLPEISPVYGRKLSTSATGLLDCLVKLQLIDHNPNNTNERDKKYQDLMHILQSLWLCDPSENEQKPTRSDNRCVEDDYNHTSSSGVDVNSGSTGSGKSSDGIKSSNSNHEDASQPVCKDTKGDAVWHSEREEQKEEDNPETNDTIRNNDSPRETPETPSSSNKSSGTSSTISQKVIQEAELKGEEDLDPESHILSTRADLTKSMSHNPDPVWVINLLTKIEKQFMVHYVSAMKEFKGRWNLADNDQLDEIINELKAEIERRIQKSINREVKKIQDSVGLPRPPNDTVSQESTSQAKERKQKLKKRLQHSAGSQDEISGNSTTGTPYSDQRSDNTDESCPCETCIKKRKNSEASLRMEATNAAHSGNCRNSDEIKVAETLVENVVFAAVKEVEGEKVEQCTENTSSYEVDKKGDDCESMESLTKHEKQKKPVVAEWDSEDDVNETLGEEAKTVDETPLEGETEDFDEDESEEIKTKAVDDKDAIMEADAETAAEEESAKDENPEEELVKNEIRVINEPELLNELSVASTAEKEEGNTETAEVSMAATHENKSERDEVVEDFDEAEHESVKEAALEIGSVNDEEEDGGLEDFDEDSNSTTNDDDTSDDTTSHGLSSEAADDAKEDEVAVEKEFEVAREDEVCDVQTKVSAGEDETVKESDESATSEHGSVTRKNSEEGLQSDLEVVSPISEDDPPTQNQNLVSDNDLAKVPDDIATTEDDTSEEKHSTGDDESKEDTDAEEESSSEVRASSDHESESEEPVKMEKVNAEEESSAASESQSAEDLDGTSNAISGEDEPAEEAAAGRVSKHDSEKDEEEEESSVVKKEKPLETSADENRDTSTADESSSEEDAKMTNDDLATDKDQAATSQSESKDETDEDETGTEEADKDEETELHTQEDTADDVNDTGVISEDLSTEDETPKENVAMCRDPLNEQSEKDLPKTEEEPATPETNSDYPGVTSGAENDSKEGEPDQANNEDPTAIFKEPDQEEVTANRESEDENEEDHGETPVVDQVDITSEDGEEDTTSSQDDSADDEDASTKEEISAAEKETSGEEEINKVNQKLTETSNEEELDDCSVKDDHQSTRTESSSEDESKEESKNSGTDESRPGSTVTDANDTTGQDESRVSNDSESPDDSEAEPKNQVVDEILQEASDENETPSRSEEQEKTKSSEKPADSNASELLTEDKSEEDKSYSEDVMEQEHKVPEEKSGDVITENETKDESGEEETGAGEETDVLTIITDEGQAFKEDTGRKDVQKSESKDFNSCEKEKNMDDALDKEEETETANDDWSGDEGNSADEEDEAEEDSDEPEEHTQAELKPLVISKATNQSQPDRQGKETLLMPLDTLKKEKDESEDGTYADIEDSETEINSQK